MVDMALLFSECPDLRRAGKVILVHGERAEGASEELEKEMR